MARRQEAERRLQKMTAGLIEKLTPLLFAPVSMQQMVTSRDKSAKGPVWVSRTTLNKPGDCNELKSVLVKAFKERRDLLVKIIQPQVFQVHCTPEGT